MKSYFVGTYFVVNKKCLKLVQKIAKKSQIRFNTPDIGNYKFETE